MHVVDLALIGLAVTLEPVPITAFILLLSSRAGGRKGAAFIVGWLASLVVVIAATLATTGGAPPRPSTAPSTAVLSVKIAIGAGLVLFAFVRRRRPARPARPPSWLARVDRMTPWAAVGLGVLLQPWVLVGAGAATVAELQVSSVASFLVLAGFCLLCTASQLAMELYAVRSPAAAAERLEGIRGWIDVHRDRAVVALSLILGLWLVGDSLSLVLS